MFRIQKILLAEYGEIYEPIIVENPFVQVNEAGEGLRQYYIGLTATKIIFGCDDFESTCLENVYYREEDPEIETFQLVSLVPLEFVNLHFFRKKNRDIMRLTICNDDEARPMFFEFGGYLFKSMFWYTWRERVATLRLRHEKLFHINGSSPYSSTDVIEEEVDYEAEVHPVPPFDTPIMSTRNSMLYSSSCCPDY